VTETAGRPICVATLGLGEAGTAFAADSIGLGVTTAGWDPVSTRSVSNLRLAESAADAVEGADLVLSLSSGASALAAAEAVAPALSPETLFADFMSSLGVLVEVVGPDPGAAAARKLLRSVFMKGLAASVLESLAAAEAAGCADWLRADIAATLRDADESLVDRLVGGSKHHAVRRSAEMEAAAELLRELGVEPRLAQAAAGVLRNERDS
jgi:3-hydroxyisobutyrate dehydrogenase-like beta-hydroxyacid dehydrogenase